MIEVIRGSVKINGEKYVVGDVVKGLSKNDEARLVEKGIAKYPDGAVEKKQPETNKKNDKKAEQEIPVDDEVKEELVDDGQITFNPDDYIEAAAPSRKKTGKTGK